MLYEDEINSFILLSFFYSTEDSFNRSTNVCSAERVLCVCVCVCLVCVSRQGAANVWEVVGAKVVSSLDLSASSFSSLTSPWIVMWLLLWFPLKEVLLIDSRCISCPTLQISVKDSDRLLFFYFIISQEFAKIVETAQFLVGSSRSF